MNQEESFLGTGWGFPPTFDPTINTVTMASGVDDIRESLTILFDTELGERVMQPKYGASLGSMVMEPINRATLIYIEDLATTAIIYHEPRIKLIRLEVSEANQSAGILHINVIFEIRSTNTRFNFVYPFYIQEGTDI
ncbi:MAG TPA: GPW/gp25 family protein [Cyclobacteriaceae bacterium]|nr:GPW/gp25 family protein [Cyclobacteriaceae bacterium]